MHKIITKKYIINIVKENIHKVDENIFKNILKDKNIPVNEGINKESLIKMIEYHKINLWKVYQQTKDKEFGVSKAEVRKILDIEESIFDKLIEKKLINIAYTKKILIENNELIENYYFLEDIYNLSKEKLIKFREKHLKEKDILIKDVRNKDNHIAKALKKRIYDEKKNSEFWKGFISKNNVIVSVVSTGNNFKRDEIIEIGILDMDGKIIYHNTFKTNKRVSDESYAIKRIDKDSISQKKTFRESIDEIYSVLEGKVILAYNSELICNLLKGNGYVNKLEETCLMKSYMNYVHSKYIIRIKRALNMQNIEENLNKSKSLGECFDLLELIKAVHRECEKKVLNM